MSMSVPPLIGIVGAAASLIGASFIGQKVGDKLWRAIDRRRGDPIEMPSSVGDTIGTIVGLVVAAGVLFLLWSD